MQWIANAADVKKAMRLVRLPKSLMRRALPWKAPWAGSSQPIAWVWGFTVSLGTNAFVVPHGRQKEGLWGCLVRELEEFGREGAAMLLRWLFKAVGNQGWQPPNLTAYWGWHQRSRQGRLLLRMLRTNPQGNGSERPVRRMHLNNKSMQEKCRLLLGFPCPEEAELVK